MDAIYLTKNEFENIKKNKIGEGSDACVYRVSKDILYKIYHEHRLAPHLSNYDGIVDSEGVRIASQDALKRYNKKASIEQPSIRYVDKEGVRLCSETAILKAIERQPYIENVDLPLAPIYLNGRFKGCVLKDQHGMQLHSFRFLPKNIKRQLCLNILKQVKELVENYIYPIDLCNNPDLKAVKKGHSNILLTKKLETRLIDLDGKSALYREETTKNFLNATETSLCTLILEFFLGIDIPEELEEEDIYYLENTLKKLNIPIEFRNALASLDCSLEQMEELLSSKTFSKTK